MARPDPAVALRVPSEARRRDNREGDDDGRPRLRLVVDKGRLAIELDRPFELTPIVVEQLAVALPEVRFPVELSGGAAAFRNKRGQLDRAQLMVPARALHHWARPRLEGIVPGSLCHHMIAPLDDGWLIGLASETAALAFEVVLAPLGGDMRLLVVDARGVGLGAPPQALAARAVYALLKPLGQLTGGALVVEAAATELARNLLPLAGMRAPSARGLCFTSIASDLDGTSLALAHDAAGIDPSERALSAVELATLVAEAEAALMAGAVDRARHGYLEALTRAPRHPAIARRLASLDAVRGDRHEAALATLSDALPPVEAGPLGGRLLAAVGDVDGSQAAWRRAANDEPYGPLAALCWLELAASMPDPHDRGGPLDNAIARAPSLAAPRWMRFERRVRLGKLSDARADIEHLEAQAHDASARHRVLRRAADKLLEQGAFQEAAETFERALRYSPDSVDAVAGLGRSLKIMGHDRRALELFGRATALAERAGRAAHGVTLEMGIALAEIADDRPAAIARVRAIGGHVAATFTARLLEARWRAELGDLSGASVALSRLSEAVEASLGVLVGERPVNEGPQPRLWGEGGEGLYTTREDACAAIAAHLEEGARIQELDRRDLPAARTLLANALRLAPRSGSINSAFRRVAAIVDGPPVESATATVGGAQPESAAATSALPASEAPATVAPITEAFTAAPLSLGDELEGGPDSDDELLVEQLSEKLRANPNDVALAVELADALERLGRDHELLALLSARVDETEGEARADWTARRRTVLERLIAAAENAGRKDEAELYALMLQRS